METVTLTIDGRQVTVEKGKTVLQAAIESGVSVPYYCYHPGISIDGSCRVCIVKIEKMPKLQTSCSTVCADGMVVTTRSPEVDVAPYTLAVEHASRKLHPALIGAKRVRKILQRALAALVAHGAVERVVDKKKFKDAGARGVHLRTPCRDDHPICADGRA